MAAQFRKWMLIIRDCFRIYIPLGLAIIAILYPSLSEQQKNQLLPIAMVGVPIIAAMYLLISFHMAYSSQQAIYERESTVKESATYVSRGEALKSRIAAEWTAENSKEFLSDVSKWEDDSERAVSKYYKELGSIFRRTGNDHEHGFIENSPAKSDLRDRMNRRIDNLAHIISIIGRG